MTGNVAAFESGAPFAMDARSALDDLGSLIAGGSLTGTALEDAIALRNATRDFVNTLGRRAAAGALIPTASSAAGTQMAQRFADYVAAFDALGLMLPELSLPEFATEDDFNTHFLSQGFADRLPRDSRNELDLGEVEVFLRVNLIDGITRRRPIPGPVGDAGAGSESGADSERGIRLRTSVGGLARLPIRNRNLTIFGDPTNSADIPIGDGQTDIELALYQDIAFGSRFMIRASARYGMQRPDEAAFRFTPPDRPYGQEDLVALMRRDLGDYVAVLVRPSLRFNAALSVGIEYDYFRLPAPTYQFVGMVEGLDPNTVAAEGAQTRHRLGVGFLIDLSEAGSVEEFAGGGKAGAGRMAVRHLAAPSDLGLRGPDAGVLPLWGRAPLPDQHLLAIRTGYGRRRPGPTAGRRAAPRHGRARRGWRGRLRACGRLRGRVSPPVRTRTDVRTPSSSATFPTE